MTHKEFIKRVDELGYEVEEELHSYCILKDDDPLMHIDKINWYQIDSYTDKIESLSTQELIKLFELALEFTKTPSRDRILKKGEIK